MFLLSANYLENWKCIAKLKGDGSGSEGQVEDMGSQSALVPVVDSSASTSVATGSRYYQLTPVGSRKEVVWH